MNLKTYEKPPLTITQQVALLESRGMIVKNKEQAMQSLRFISYYRFCGYAHEFKQYNAKGGQQNCYNLGTTFEQVLNRYIFDRKLRLLVIDAIERIEISVRTVMSNELALQYGSHWYTNKDIFLPTFKHVAFIQKIQQETSYQVNNKSNIKRREQFIDHYYNNYSTPELPPIWMVAEVLSLGVLSTLFANLIYRKDQKIICQLFGLSYKIMTSWLHSLTYLRNICAHHSKLWDRKFIFEPIITRFLK